MIKHHPVLHRRGYQKSKLSPNTEFHNTAQVCRLYQKRRSFTNLTDTPFCNNLNRRPECNTLSNALFASKETQKTLLPLQNCKWIQLSVFTSVDNVPLFSAPPCIGIHNILDPFHCTLLPSIFRSLVCQQSSVLVNNGRNALLFALLLNFRLAWAMVQIIGHWCFYFRVKYVGGEVSYRCCGIAGKADCCRQLFT